MKMATVVKQKLTFEESLIEGEKFELYVAEKLKEKYGFHLIKNPDEMGVDLIGTHLFEIKYDIESDNTNNYFLETSCNGVASGVLRYEYDYYCIGTYDLFVVYTKEQLINMILLHGEPKTGGDGNRVKGFIIPKKTLIMGAKLGFKK